MRVAIDIQNLLMPKTGVGYYVSGLISAISRLENSDDFFLFYFSRNRKINLPSQKKHIHEHRIESQLVRLYGILWKWLEFPGADRFLPVVDVIHFPNFFMRPVSKGHRVLTIHDLSFVRYPQHTEPKNLTFLTRQVKKAIDKSDMIIADSDFTRDEIIDVYSISPSQVVTVYPGVRQEFQPDIPEDIMVTVKNKYRLPERYILFVGTIEPRKNIIGLIEAHKILRASSRSFQDIKLVICGMPGWLCDETMKKLREPDVSSDIVMTGYVDEEDLPAIYRSAEILVLPSWYEGFGFPCLEAMACGTPVICSEKSSMSEICGENAVIIDPSKPESITDGISSVLSDEALRLKLITNGINHSRTFNWERTAKETIGVYRSVI